MIDLVWKDFVAARRLLWLVIPLGGVQVAVMSFIPPIYVTAVLIFSALLGFGSIWVEEYQGTELLWNSLPVTRGQFVAARYLTTLIGMVAGLALSLTLAQAVTRMASGVADGPAAFLGFPAHVVMFAFLVLAAAIYLPLYFRFGAGRGLMFFLAIAMAVVVIVSLVTQQVLAAKGYPSPVADPEAWRTLMMRMVERVEPRLGQLLSLVIGAAALATGVSMLISRRVYQARDL
jgi:ABC-type transport system involved in multi-copper enzyme maturation permease subunit